jgi:hypothetical protein
MHQAVSTRRATWAEAVTATLAILNAVAALAGAGGLVSGILDLGPEVTGRLPFGSPVLAGLALGAFVGLPNLALSALAIVRHPLAAPASAAVGLALIVWIVVQLTIIRELSFFHPLYVVVGLLMIVAGLRQASRR